jgi:hypothetical protein
MQLKPYYGVVLMAVGALLLLICRLAHCQSNTELLVGLLLVLGGFIWHVRQLKGKEKY